MSKWAEKIIDFFNCRNRELYNTLGSILDALKKENEIDEEELFPFLIKEIKEYAKENGGLIDPMNKGRLTLLLTLMLNIIYEVRNKQDQIIWNINKSC